MPHWLLKWAVQRTISVLPHRQKFNEFFQTHFTRTLDATRGRFEARLEYCRMHLDYFLEQRPGLESFTVFELGTGWYPTVPVGLYLCGADEIWLADIDPLLKSERLLRMVEQFCECEAEGRLLKMLPLMKRDRFERLRELKTKLKEERAENWLKRFNINVFVGDAQHTPLPNSTIDFFFSTGVLEYIPEPILRGILKEFKRVGSLRAISSHCIDFLDQMSFFDKSLSPFNYLKYTEAQWKLWSSPLIRQNRLMVPDYRKLFSDEGYEITKEVNTSGSDADFDRVKLAPQFRNYRREDLMILRSWMVAKPR
jgi:hypothetical protein